MSPDSASQLVGSHTIPLICFAILYYDYALTFTAEVTYFWPPRNQFRWPVLLFFMNRYLVVCGHVVMVLDICMYPKNISLSVTVLFRCSYIYKFHEPYVGVVQLVVIGLCITRVSAMYNNHRLVLGFLTLEAAAIVGVTVSSVLADMHAGEYPLLPLDSVPGCNPLVTAKYAKRIAIPWSALLVFDFSIFFLTLYKALRCGQNPPIKLVTILVRDGALYFGVLFTVNLTNVFMLFYAPPLLKNVNTIVSNVLSSTLMSRLMLNLRDEANRKEDSEAQLDTLSVPRFRTGSSVSSTEDV